MDSNFIKTMREIEEKVRAYFADKELKTCNGNECNASECCGEYKKVGESPEAGTVKKACGNTEQKKLDRDTRDGNVDVWEFTCIEGAKSLAGAAAALASTYLMMQ